MLSNTNGCDSLVTLDLTINNSYSTTDNHGACDSYTWIDGNTYTTSNNTATVMLTSISGCDSLVTLDLIIDNSLTGTDVITACDSYTWIDGTTYTSSNNSATILLTASGGCDSLVTLNLTLGNSNTGTDVITSCDSYTWIDGTTYTSSNNSATVVLSNASGCDSTVTLDLTITNSNTGTDVITSCDSYTWIDGVTYTSSNNSATVVLSNTAGCDSTVTLDLTITNSNTGTDVITSCDSYTWINGTTYTSSNNSATVVLSNTAGCDSTVTLDLTITNSNTGTDVITSCDSYTWIDGTTYTASNNSATVVLSNAAGCDSTVTLDLTINNTPSFTLAGTDPSVCNASDGVITLSGLNANTSYVLDYDSLSFTSQQINIITDATGNYLLTGLSAGEYANFSMTYNGCTFTSLDVMDLNNPGAPIIDAQSNVVECDTYTLGDITGVNLSGNEGYYTESNGGGIQLNSGEIISTSQTIYIYDILGTCADESGFTVTINNTPSIINPGPQEVCESYFLPLSISGTNLSGNENYYTDLQSNGGTVIIDAITSSQTVYIYDENGACSNEVSFEITINSLPSLVSFTGEGEYCDGDVINDLIAEVSGTADYTLEYTLDGNLLSISSSNSSISLGNSPGIYTLSSLNDNACGISLNETQVIVVNSTPDSPMLDEDATYCSNTLPESIQATGSTGTYTWYSDESLNDFIGTEQSYTPNVEIGSVTYYVTATENGCEGIPAEVTITFENCEILIPTAFTPDGDQINDTWILGNIDDVYPNNIVSVYNRLGNKVYESDQGAYSDRPWGGEYNGTILPVASYYYVIEYNDDTSENINGTVSIIK
jgi:gliding motility-associated-like protein